MTRPGAKLGALLKAGALAAALALGVVVISELGERLGGGRAGNNADRKQRSSSFRTVIVRDKAPRKADPSGAGGGGFDAMAYVPAAENSAGAGTYMKNSDADAALATTASTAAETAFDRNALKDDAVISYLIETLQNDPAPENREAALELLSYAPLVNQPLLDSVADIANSHESSATRISAIHTMRSWMIRHPQLADLLIEDLNKAHGASNDLEVKEAAMNALALLEMPGKLTFRETTPSL